MKDLKQECSKQLLKIKEFVLKKDENSKIRYKNLLYIGAVVLAVIIAIIAVVPKSRNSTMELNPNDTSNTADEVLFEDNNAVAVAPDMTDTLNIENKNIEGAPAYDEYPEDNDTAAQSYEDEVAGADPFAQIPRADNVSPVQDASVPSKVKSAPKPKLPPESEIEEPKSAAKAPAPETAAVKYVLFCDSFSSQDKASERKANIALSTGIISTVVKRNAGYQLRIGDFRSRDEAIKVFNRIDESSLVNECQLETK